VTDTTLSDWDAGYAYGDGMDDDDVVTPTAVTPPVTAAITETVTRPVTPAVTPGVTRDEDGPVTPEDGGPAGPLRVGRWTEAEEAGPDRDDGIDGILARLAAATRDSPLLGGSSLAAELASSRPGGTWARHWQRVTRHESLPDGRWAAIGFAAGHLAVTGPLKLAGKAMTVTGNALTWTGTRTDRASDNFASAAIFIVLAAAMTAILVIAAGQAISCLP
jgi:hypothetical protein